MDKDAQAERIRKIHSYEVLSYKAIAAIFAVTEHRVRQVLSRAAKPEARGTLNPHHLGWLAYGLSNKYIAPGTLQTMIREGTSQSTIADLTSISRSSLTRWRTL